MSRPLFCHLSARRKWWLSSISFTSGEGDDIVLDSGLNALNRQGLEEANFSAADWCDLLSISHRYECGRARERSIREINAHNPPIDNADKIAMAKKFEVEEWLLPACVALVERQDPLTYAEAEKLGLDMTVLISEAREKYIQRQRNPADTLGGEPANEDTTQLVKDVLGIQ